MIKTSAYYTAGYAHLLERLNIKTASSARFKGLTQEQHQAHADRLFQRIQDFKNNNPQRNVPRTLQDMYKLHGQAVGKLKPGTRLDGTQTVGRGLSNIGDSAMAQFKKLSPRVQQNFRRAGAAGILGAGLAGGYALTRGIDGGTSGGVSGQPMQAGFGPYG